MGDFSDSSYVTINGDITIPSAAQMFLDKIYLGIGLVPTSVIKVMRIVPIFSFLEDNPTEKTKGLGAGVSIAKYVLERPGMKLIELLTDSSIDGIGQGEYARFSLSAEYEKGRDFLEDYPEQREALSHLLICDN